MEAWIKNLINAARQALEDLGQAVTDRLLAFYNWVTKALTAVGGQFGRLLTAAGAVKTHLVSVVSEGLSTLTWLLKVRIPALIKAADEALRRWGAALVTAAKNELKGMLATLDKWAKSAWTTATKAIADLRSWATTQVNALLASLVYVRTIVVALLTSPARLASWLVGAMVSEIWRYADRNADRIILWAQRRSVAYTASMVGRIEQLLGRLL